MQRHHGQRHHGLDWLRIGAFAILILYHVGMAFVPWPFHLKLARADGAVVPMLLPNAWRLSLLFLVSGYASRALLARSTGLAAFARSRTARLLVPALFAIVVVVPPQPWVELRTQHGYRHSFGWFWLHDYWRFGMVDGLILPTWNHLWFVVYLWIYTLLLAGAAAVALPVVRKLAQRAFDRVLGGWGALLLPPIWLAVVNQQLFPGARESHALVDDWVAHATYLPMFLFGVGLGGSERALTTFRRRWPWTGAVALLAYAGVAWVAWRFAGYRVTPRPWGDVYSIGRAVQAWAAIAALLGIAERFWNRDGRWRATLTQAVFPFYIVHQTVIVVAGYWLIGAGLPLGVDFVLLVLATAAGCWAFYVLGRRIGWLRPLIGLRR